MKYINFSLSKKSLLAFASILVSVCVFFIPRFSDAATITASSTDTIASGDTSIIHVYLDTEGEVINSVDGAVTLSDEHGGNFEIKDLNTTNSVFTLWPNKPSLETGHAIKFIGGTPGGVTGERLLLFKIVLKINQTGIFTITPGTTTAYLNDGVPTPRLVTKETSSITVGPPRADAQDKWTEVISNDNTAPFAFTVSLISDPYLYDGKKFVSFETTDSESGISHYEVQEGARTPVRSGTNYILIDQKNNIDITVTAYDKAGNFQVAVLSTREPINWLGIIATLFILGIVYFIIKKLRKKKK